MNSNKIDIRNLAIFDFCETLVDLQSADEFISFCLFKNNRLIRYTIFNILNNFALKKIIRKLFLYDINPKKIGLLFLKGINLKDFYDLSSDFVSVLDDCAINESFRLLKKHKENGDLVVIASGGFDIYIELFLVGKVDIVLATKLLFKDGVFSGGIDGAECLGEEKVKRIRDVLSPNDFDSISIYSDSETDLPIFLLGHNRVVVSKGKKKHWVKKYCGMNEIVWTK